MKTEDLDRLIRESLAEEGRRARFDPDGWMPSVMVGPRRKAGRAATWRTAAVAVAAALVVAAVAIPLVLLSPLRRGPADDPPPGRTLGRPADLWGTRFRAASIIEDGKPRPLVHDTHLDVSFRWRRLTHGPNEDPRPDRPDRGIIGWSVGCNGHGARLRITSDRLLIEDDGISTLIKCLGPLEAQEEWAGRFFASDPYWTLEGDVLTLSSGTTVIELRRRGGASASGTTTHADADDGYSITIPSDWTFHQDPSGPPDPNTRTLFAVGSWTFPRGGECAPTEALSALPPDGVLLWINETDPELSAIDVVPRPEHFDLDEAPSIQPACSPAPYTYQWFAENDRYLQINVAYGENAAQAVREHVLRALDSMVLTAPVPEDCPDDVGPWADLDCPEQAWVRAVVDNAGYEVTGDTGSALIGDAPDSGFYIWATAETRLRTEPTFREAIEKEGYRPLASIDGTTIFTDGIRAVWTVEGLHVWVSGGPVDDLPGRDVLASLVEASGAVDYDAIDTR